MKAVQWVRRVYGIPVPSPVAAGEVSVKDAARQLGCSPGVVYYWIETGQLETRRSSGNRLCIPWTPNTEAECRARIAASGHLNAQPAHQAENAPLPRAASNVGAHWQYAAWNEVPRASGQPIQ